MGQNDERSGSDRSARVLDQWWKLRFTAWNFNYACSEISF